MRVIRLLRNVAAGRDIASGLFLGFLFVVGVWLLSIPTIPWAAEATMNRFHLRTQPFSAWASQQVVPSMYNFENSFAFYPNEVLPDQAQSFLADRQINHFPFRVITFFDYRKGLFGYQVGGKLVVVSRFQQNEVKTTWYVEWRDGTYLVTRKE